MSTGHDISEVLEGNKERKEWNKGTSLTYSNHETHPTEQEDGAILVKGVEHWNTASLLGVVSWTCSGLFVCLMGSFERPAHAFRVIGLTSGAFHN